LLAAVQQFSPTSDQTVGSRDGSPCSDFDSNPNVKLDEEEEAQPNTKPDVKPKLEFDVKPKIESDVKPDLKPETSSGNVKAEDDDDLVVMQEFLATSRLSTSAVKRQVAQLNDSKYTAQFA
jgi:hypothetical protein